MFQSIYTTIVSNIQSSLGQGSGWVIDWVVDHTVSISKYNLLAESSYIKLPNELDYTRKGLINIQNIDDNECFKSSIARYVNPANHHPARISKSDQDFAKKLDIKDIKFPVKIIHKIEKKRYSLVLVFLTLKIRKNI